MADAIAHRLEQRRRGAWRRAAAPPADRPARLLARIGIPDHRREPGLGQHLRAIAAYGASTPVMVGSIRTPPRGRSACVMWPCDAAGGDLFGADHALSRLLMVNCEAARGIYPVEQLADHLGGVVDHRDDAGVVQPGRADHADHADDAAGAVVIGRDDGRGARQREQLVLRADEDAHALGALGAAEQVDHARAAVSRSSNSSRTRSRSSSALRSSSRWAWPRTISWRSSLSPPDQLASPAVDHLLGQLIELGLAGRARLLQLGLAPRPASCRGCAR